MFWDKMPLTVCFNKSDSPWKRQASVKCLVMYSLIRAFRNVESTVEEAEKELNENASSFDIILTLNKISRNKASFGLIFQLSVLERLNISYCMNLSCHRLIFLWRLNN